MKTFCQSNMMKIFITILLTFFIIISGFSPVIANAENQRVLSSIEIITQPKVLEYAVGDTFNSRGLKVVANYANGDFCNVPNSLLGFTYDFSSAGQKTVTISYSENGVAKTVSVDAKVYNAPSLSVLNKNAKKGEIVEVPVSINNNIGLMGIKVLISYDSSVLYPIDIVETGYFGNGFVNDNIATSDDSSFYIIWNGTESIDNDGKMFVARFNCIETPSSGKTDVEVEGVRADTFTELYNTMPLTSTKSIITIEGQKDISVKYNGVSLRKGSMFQLSALTTPDDLQVSWKSNDEEVAKVDSNGKVTGVSAGKTTIIAYLSDDEDIYKEIDVEVQNGEDIEHEHEWSESILKDASCSEYGTKAYYCSICGESYEEMIEKVPHTNQTIPAISPSCVKKGQTSGVICSVCNTILVEPKVVNELGHNWNNGVITRTATCSVEGEKTYSCTRCTEKKTEKLDKVSHNVVVDPAVEATETKTGLTEGAHCSVCGEIIVSQTVIPKLEKEGKNVDDKSENDKENPINDEKNSENHKDDSINDTDNYNKDNSNKEEDKSDKTNNESKSDNKNVDKKEDVSNQTSDAGTKSKTATDNSGNKEIGTVDNAPVNTYKNEWINGKWYGENGEQTYEGTLMWKSNSTGWWVEDSAGWYPTNAWYKIDGVWYYFKPDGYMASNEYYGGYWFNADGSWDETYYIEWKSNSTGWWIEDISGWWPSSCWLKIDNYWYYFDGSGYMVTNQYIDGYWLGADGVCY